MGDYSGFGIYKDANSGGTLTNVTIANTVFVMKNGNDSTGLRERLDKPFLTINAAKSAALAGDTIVVYAGIYNEKNILKNNVNYDFIAGSAVIYTGSDDGAILDDGATNGAGGAVSCTIEGIGVFRNLGTGSDNRVINIENASSLTIYASQLVNNQSGVHTIKVNNAGASLGIISNNISNSHASTGKLIENVNSSVNISFRGGALLIANNNASVIDVSGGRIRFEECRITNENTGATAHIIDKTGGTLILKSATLISLGASGSKSLINSGGGTQDVLVYAGSTNVPVDATSITQSVATLIEDTAVI